MLHETSPVDMNNLTLHAKLEDTCRNWEPYNNKNHEEVRHQKHELRMACIAAQGNDIFLTQVVVKELDMLHGPSCVVLGGLDLTSSHCLSNRSTKNLELAPVPGATCLQLFCQLCALCQCQTTFSNHLCQQCALLRDTCTDLLSR